MTVLFAGRSSIVEAIKMKAIAKPAASHVAQTKSGQRAEPVERMQGTETAVGTWISNAQWALACASGKEDTDKQQG